MTRVSDEMLMAYVDGELDAQAADDVRRAAAADATLARRAEMFRESRRVAGEAFAGLKAGPVPAELIDAVMQGRDNVVAFEPRRRLLRTALPLAAAIALAFGFGGYWFGLSQAPVGVEVMGSQAIAAVLGETASGVQRSFATGVGEGRLHALATYRVEDGLCRTFELSGAGLSGPVRGVGCSRGGSWHVDLVAASGSEDGFSPAASAATGSIDAYLDAVGAEGPLSAEQEAAAEDGPGRR